MKFLWGGFYSWKTGYITTMVIEISAVYWVPKEGKRKGCKMRIEGLSMFRWKQDRGCTCSQMSLGQVHQNTTAWRRTQLIHEVSLVVWWERDGQQDKENQQVVHVQAWNCPINRAGQTLMWDGSDWMFLGGFMRVWFSPEIPKGVIRRVFQLFCLKRS